MIWIGTSGWIYPHWRGRFYPHDLPAHSRLSYYADTFATVEINRSFYRLPTSKQFRVWAEQVEAHPHFLFAIKASRYLTHMKKLLNAEEGIVRLKDATSLLGEHLGPFLYQLPPHWRANPLRLAQFISGKIPKSASIHLEAEKKSLLEMLFIERYGMLNCCQIGLVVYPVHQLRLLIALVMVNMPKRRAYEILKQLQNLFLK